MRLEYFVAAVLAVTPVVAPSQGAPEQAARQVATIDVMKANVAGLVTSPEKARWEANIELWQLRSENASLTREQVDRMNLIIDRIFTNVARVTRPAEKARWQANLDMWKIVSASPDKVSKLDVVCLQTLLQQMRDNVARIVEPTEKQRWEANRDLWRAELLRMTTAAQ